jgi:uncharacterized protein
MGAIYEYPRLLHPPLSSFFLLGVRGAGKSTWAREPGLLDEVHRFIEERELRFALVGSSARKLRSGGTNLLAGRAVSRTLFPLVPSELGEDFDMERVMRLGSIPVVWAADDPLGALEAYVQLYLEEEIRAEALVRNLPGFALPAGGRALPRPDRQRGFDRSRRRRGPVDDRRLRRDPRGHASRAPAPGVRSPCAGAGAKAPEALLGRSGSRARGEAAARSGGGRGDGPAVRGDRAHDAARAQGRAPDLRGARLLVPHQSRVEVDFLLRRGRELIAIEAKAASRFSRSHVQGLLAIADVPGVVRRILVYRGDRQLRTPEGIEVWPLSVLSETLAQDRLWP